ncbi:MAG: sucrase ferredoxin [Acidimicrobiia bacterium]
MDLRCAAWARTEGVDPIGTAGCYAGFLGVDWRRPWPRDVSEVEALAPLVAATTERGFRLQGLLPVDGAKTARVVLYQAGPGPGFDTYRRLEVECAPDEVVDAAAGLLGRPAAEATVAPPGGDVLVCTHGRRDICCGSRGTALLGEVDDAGVLPAGTRLWATTHTGGHRFAPNAIVLPEGTVWGFLDAGRLGRIVRREGPVDDLLPHYRGCAGLGSPAQQALERAVLGEVGWDLFACRRTGTELGEGRVRLEVTDPDSAVRAWEAVVEVGRVLPVPDCGQPVTAAVKTEPELVLTGLRRDDERF